MQLSGKARFLNCLVWCYLGYLHYFLSFKLTNVCLATSRGVLLSPAQWLVSALVFKFFGSVCVADDPQLKIRTTVLNPDLNIFQLNRHTGTTASS